MGIDKAFRKNILAVADAYARATGLSIASVSRKFHGNQAFLKKLREGSCTVTLDKAEEMVDAFRKAWPPDVAWPAQNPIWM